jgi:hypothetical protein
VFRANDIHGHRRLWQRADDGPAWLEPVARYDARHAASRARRAHHRTPAAAIARALSVDGDLRARARDIFIRDGGDGIGISGIPPLEIGDISFAEPGMFYILAWILCGFTLAGYALLADSHIGRAWRALATGQDIAATLGIDVPGYKLLAFVLAAVIASIVGSFYVEFTSFVGPLFPPCRANPVISLCSLHGNLLFRPVKLGSVDPHAVQNDHGLSAGRSR